MKGFSDMKVLCPKPSVKSETHGNATLSDFFGGGGVCGGGSRMRVKKMS